MLAPNILLVNHLLREGFVTLKQYVISKSFKFVFIETLNRGAKHLQRWRPPSPSSTRTDLFIPEHSLQGLRIGTLVSAAS